MGCGDGVRRRAEEPKARQPLGTAPELHEFHGRPFLESLGAPVATATTARRIA